MSITTAATVLVAEENDMNRAFLDNNLSAYGYRVITAPERWRCYPPAP